MVTRFDNALPTWHVVVTRAKRTPRDILVSASEGGDYTVAFRATTAFAGPRIDSYTPVAQELETRVSAWDRSVLGGDACFRRLCGDAGRTARQGGKDVDADARKGKRMAYWEFAVGGCDAPSR